MFGIRFELVLGFRNHAGLPFERLKGIRLYFIHDWCFVLVKGIGLAFEVDVWSYIVYITIIIYYTYTYAYIIYYIIIIYYYTHAYTYIILFQSFSQF